MLESLININVVVLLIMKKIKLSSSSVGKRSSHSQSFQVFIWDIWWVYYLVRHNYSLCVSAASYLHHFPLWAFRKDQDLIVERIQRFPHCFGLFLGDADPICQEVNFDIRRLNMSKQKKLHLYTTFIHFFFSRNLQRAKTTKT